MIPRYTYSNYSVKFDDEKNALFCVEETGRAEFPQSGIACIWPINCTSDTQEYNLVLHIGPVNRGIEQDTERTPTPSPMLPLGYQILDLDLIPPALEKYACYSRREHLLHQQYWLVSTLSGKCDAKGFFDSVICPASDKTRKFTDILTNNFGTSITDSPESIYTFAAGLGAAAIEDKAQSIFLLSGDGGVFEFINGLMNNVKNQRFRPPNIGLLPFGTGNALANSSRINSDDTHGLRTIYTGEARPLPTFGVKFRSGAEVVTDQQGKIKPIIASETIWGSVVVSWGLHASLVAESDSPEYRKHGQERFVMAAKELLSPKDGSETHRYKGIVSKIKIAVDGSKQVIPIESNEHMYCLVTMVSNFEKHLTISPASEPLDGKLWLVHFGPTTPEGFMEIMTAAYQGGKHVDDARVRYEEVDGLQIEMHEENVKWRRICVDGKIIEVARGGCVEVTRDRMTPTAVNLIVPAV